MNHEAATHHLNGSPALRPAVAYMVTALLLFLLLGLLGLLMRLNQGDVIVLPPLWFYRIMTLHGAGMVAAALVGASGGLSAVLSPSVRLRPRLLWIVLALYFVAAALLGLSTLVGSFAGGWTMLPPLPFVSGREWTVRAAITFMAAYLVLGLGFLLYCLEILRATTKAYGGLGGALAWRYLVSGGKKNGNPLPSPSDLAATAVALDGVLTVAAMAALLVQMLFQAAGLAHQMDVLLAKNLMYFSGHMLANLTIYLSAGLVYATLPYYTGRHASTSWPIVLAFNVLLLGVILPYPHHLYEDFVQPLWMQIAGQVGSYAAGVPVILVTVMSGLTQIYGSRLKWSVAPILIAWGLWGWVFGGIGALLDSTIGVNQMMHNTLWVPAHFHTYYLLGALAFTWAYLYHLTAELSDSHPSRLSNLAAWMYGVGGVGFVAMFFLAGAHSVPRRYAMYFVPEWRIFPRIAVPFVIILAAGIAWLSVEILARLARAWRRIADVAAVETADRVA